MVRFGLVRFYFWNRTITLIYLVWFGSNRTEPMNTATFDQIRAWNSVRLEIWWLSVTKSKIYVRKDLDVDRIWHGRMIGAFFIRKYCNLTRDSWNCLSVFFHLIKTCQWWIETTTDLKLYSISHLISHPSIQRQIAF